jgi:hypothetical protein
VLVVAMLRDVALLLDDDVTVLLLVLVLVQLAVSIVMAALELNDTVLGRESSSSSSKTSS